MEKKTFSHPIGMTSAFTAPTDSGAHYEVYSQGSYYKFPLDTWDIEVTFTKKVAPLRADERVVDEEGDAATIIAVVRDKAWIKYDMYGHMEEIVELDNLTRIGESDD